ADLRLSTAWNPVRAAALDLRFAASGRPYGPATALVTRAAIDHYAGAWRTQAIAACQAGDARLDPTLTPLVQNREACLDGRLAGLGGTVELLAAPGDAELVDSASAVVGGLPPLAACADPERMALAPAPPVAVALQLPPVQARIAALKAKLVAGLFREVEAELPGLRHELDALAWPPLQLQGLLLEGDLHLGDVHPQREPILAAARLAMALGLRDEAAGAWTAMVQAEGLLGTADSVDAYHQIASAAAQAAHDPSRVLRERVAYGRALLRRGLGPRAEEVCTAALADARADASTAPRDLAGARDCVLEGAVRAGHYQQAEQLADEAMADRALFLDDQHPAIADYLEVEANAYRITGQLDRARDALTRGLALRERAFGPKHARVAESLVALADVEPDPARKLDLLQRALAIVDDPAAAGPRGPLVAVKVHGTLAELAMRAGDLAAMQAHYDQTIAIQTAETGARSLEVGFLELGYGQYLSKVDLDRSLTMLADGEAILDASGDPRLVMARGARALVLCRAGRWADALPILEKIEPALPADTEPINLGLTRWNLARALDETGGDRGRARAMAMLARADFARAGADGAASIDAIDA
ncbi:MAG TPA: tetratricopeptide repeat protein, partial [Kofleriaceae bacterium]|nr:tetratricopeptide repeat protein [Kofleriaceae bacterium]